KGSSVADEATKQRTQQRRAEQAEDGLKAMAEYLANAATIRERTAKLRELRLEREAAEAAARQPPAKSPKIPAAKLSVANPSAPAKRAKQAAPKARAGLTKAAP